MIHMQKDEKTELARISLLQPLLVEINWNRTRIVTNNCVYEKYLLRHFECGTRRRGGQQILVFLRKGIEYPEKKEFSEVISKI